AFTAVYYSTVLVHVGHGRCNHVCERCLRLKQLGASDAGELLQSRGGCWGAAVQALLLGDCCTAIAVGELLPGVKLRVSALKRINKGTKVVLLDRYGPSARTVAKELGRKGYTKVRLRRAGRLGTKQAANQARGERHERGTAILLKDGVHEVQQGAAGSKVDVIYTRSAAPMHLMMGHFCGILCTVPAWGCFIGVRSDCCHPLVPRLKLLTFHPETVCRERGNVPGACEGPWSPCGVQKLHVTLLCNLPVSSQRLHSLCNLYLLSTIGRPEPVRRLFTMLAASMRSAQAVRPVHQQASRVLPVAHLPVLPAACLPSPVSAAAFLRPARCDVPLRRSLACAAASAPPAEETYQYQAEVDRLMDMIVNSLYSNREVFLRELISNASDALDKVRFVAVTKPEVMKGREEIEIKVKADKNTIVIEDSGIGMTREQLLSNLGTIARSGTRKFLEMQKEQKAGGDSNLIGQFGVGFYSAFLVADRVVVQSKSADEGQQWVWEAAAGSHQYKIYEDKSGEDLVRGTRVTLHLKEDAQELADPIRLSRLIKQYSQFISFPIKLYNMKKEPAKVVDAEATKRKQDAENKRAAEKAEEPVQVEPVMKTEYQEVWDWRVENENKPLWTRAPKDVPAEAYNDFFKQTFSEFLDPLAHVHFNVEGTIEFSAILYVPGMAPFDQQNMNQRSRSIKLYVKRVFISDEFDEDLMPR
ncbi:HATPase_c domain-containing protein, partial [Haematococcus lacustris]